MNRVYRYRVTFPQNKTFYRDYEIKEDTTLYALHKFITDDLGFAPDQMIAFKGLDSKQKPTSVYGLFDMGNGTIDGVTIQKTIDKGESVILYVFDLDKNKHLIFTLIEQVDYNPRASYPRLIAERGRIPGQFTSALDSIDDLSIVNGVEESGLFDDFEDNFSDE